MSDTVEVVPMFERLGGAVVIDRLVEAFYRRMETQKNKKEAAEAARKREEMADWLTVYHGLQDELDQPDNAGPNP